MTAIGGARLWSTFTVDLHPLPRSISVPRGAPLNFAAEQSGSRSAGLTWSAPAKSLRYGQVVMYEIHFHKLKQAVDVFQVNATATTQIIDSLEINQDYIFQIRAYTSKGAGPWSNRLPLKITGQRKSSLLAWLASHFYCVLFPSSSWITSNCKLR